MKIIKLYFLLLFALPFCAFGQTKQYIIDGEFIGAPDSTQVYCMDDTTYIIKGKFSFKGNIEYPILSDIKVNSINSYGYPGFKGSKLWIESGNTKVTCKWEELPELYEFSNNIKIEGSKLNNEYCNFRNTLKSLPKSDVLFEEYVKVYLMPAVKWENVDVERGKYLVKKMDSIEVAKRNILLNFVNNNPSSPITIELLSELLQGQDFTAQEAKLMIESINPKLKQTPSFFKLKKLYESFIKTAKGVPYMDLTLKNINGEEVKLSQFIKKGEYTMLEFWASWCKPCRAEIPHLRHVNNDYKDKFNIISISLDEKKNQWEEAVNGENMEWTQLNDPKSWRGESAKKYKITGVPFSIILDKDGKIITGNLRGAKLDIFLESIFK